MEFWTAFTMGLFGSLHCVGMCGPIAMSLPYQGSSRVRTVVNALSYNLGRTSTYGLIGIIPGLIGTSFFMAGYQKGISIGLGVLFLLIALFSINVEQQLFSTRLYQRWSSQVQKLLGSYLKNRQSPAFFSIGMINGFLPCGLVYVALAGAMTQSSIGGGVWYMLLFGMGTLPLMLAASLTGNLLGIKVRKYLYRLYPLVLIFFALLFIFRGTNIDLPANLQFSIETAFQRMCH